MDQPEKKEDPTRVPERTEQRSEVPDQPISGRTADDANLFEAITRATVRDRDGHRLGRVGQLFLDDRSGRASWITVRTGLFGTAETFVPLQGSSFDNDELTIGYSRDEISDAPRIDPEGHLDPDDEDALYQHYGIGEATARDRTDPQTDFIPVAERDTDQGDWNKTAGLHEPRPAEAERDVDPVGGLDSPTVQAAAELPPVRPRLRRHR